MKPHCYKPLCLLNTAVPAPMFCDSSSRGQNVIFECGAQFTHHDRPDPVTTKATGHVKIHSNLLLWIFGHLPSFSKNQTWVVITFSFFVTVSLKFNRDYGQLSIWLYHILPSNQFLPFNLSDTVGIYIFGFSKINSGHINW